MTILHLTLKAKWFDMIASGEKKEEYREIKPYWAKRLVGKDFAHVLFRNGYSKNARTMLIKCSQIAVAVGQEKWGAERGKLYYAITLGSIIQINVIPA
jgi:hypothetical protein